MSAKAACGVFLGVLFLLIFIAAIVPGSASWPATPPLVTAAGAALWKGRTFEVVLQGIIILAGVVSILLLLGSEKTEELHP
jgi:hypothetical protein